MLIRIRHEDPAGKEIAGKDGAERRQRTSERYASET
jgi:hypothetical protein